MGLIKAFERAFAPDERGRGGATLVLKAMRLDWLPELEKSLHRAVAAVDGILITDDLTNAEMTSLLHAVDVYVSLHRSEGFGLGMAEAMRLGKPVIATAYSSNVDFCTAENSLQVGYRLPKRWGTVALSVFNVTDEEFEFYRSSLEEDIVPARTVALTVNFASP